MNRAVVIGGLLLAVSALPAPAATSGSLTGRILGIVTDAQGVPQMGATVLLFDRFERLRERLSTDDRGGFSFDNLAIGAYSVRVSLASFIPVLKNNILVSPGARSVLNVTLAGLFSSVDLVYAGGDQRAIMSDEWKWVLRTSSAMRPVLRLLPGLHTTGMSHSSAVFSGTRGLVKVSAGEGGRVTSFGQESDLGTAFALATSLYGRNQVEVSGNLGYASQSGLPSAGFRTSFSRGDDSTHSPLVSVTMRQLFIPGRMATGLVSGTGLPALRTLSFSVDDAVELSEGLRLDYGFSLDSVSFFDRLNYASPYARVSYALSDSDTLELGYSSGVPRLDSARGSLAADVALQSELHSLALFPRISLRDGRARVQRAENFEIGYRKSAGSRTYRAAAYRERVSNAALTMDGDAGAFSSGDLLPDLFTDSYVFNLGAFQGLGYMASVTQALTGNLDVAMVFTAGEALVAGKGEIARGNSREIRSAIHHGRRRALTAQVTGTAPSTGTHLVASYQWTDRHSATPTHFFLTQRTRAEAGLNVYVRQPIPSFLSLPVRLEASADLRNLLAQGYLPFTVTDGRRLVLMHTPRSVRGGLSFIF
ncbi:MAG: carboxypeptidase regulatory-like domain-containing protein [Bryobacteraceae bacterium]